MRRRVASSGSGPRAAPRLSVRYASFAVPGIATVTAGCDTTYFSANCAHVAMPIARAHSGSGCVPSFRTRGRDRTAGSS